MRRWILLPLVCLSLNLGINNSPAAGLIVVDEAYWLRPPPRDTEPPLHRIVPPPRRHVFAPLEVRSQQAEVRITDQLASTTIDQEFYNPNAQRLQGTFLLPMPKGVQIKKFSMEIDGKQAEAELLAADKARRIYEDIVRKAKDPALLEYQGQDLLKVRIFPIEPHGTKRIKLTYSQLLKSDSGLVSYVYPLNTSKFSASSIKSLGLKIELETKQPLKSIYSPSHTAEIRRHGPAKATIGYEGKDVKPDADFQLFFSPEDGAIGLNLMTYNTVTDGGFFLLLASPGFGTDEKKAAPKDVAFVLDTSGSMSGAKLRQAKKALEFCVENLNAEDRFEIVRFATEAEPFFNGLVEASTANREKAVSFVKELKTIGGTAIDEALRKALGLRPEKSERPFVVIFLTDGLPTVGTTDPDQILAHVKKNNTANTRVFSFGIGHDVNTHLLDKITEETKAFSQYVLPEEDIEVKVSSFFTKIKDPVLVNPALTFPDAVRATKLYPSPLPDLFKGEQLVAVGRYSGSGGGKIVIEGKLNGATRNFTEEVRFPDSATEHDFIPRLWATRRVGYLMDEIRLRGENSELREEVTELARKYGIVTPFTAYLILEDEAKRGVPASQLSLSALERDVEAREVTKRAWASYNRQQSGGDAIASARYGRALKSADAPSEAVALGNVEGQRNLLFSTPTAIGPAAGAGPAPSARIDHYTQQTRFVNGRNFFQNGQQWIDSEVQRAGKNAPKPVRIQFNSKEYYDLLKQHPEVKPWLALGLNVQFALRGTVYEVYE